MTIYSPSLEVPEWSDYRDLTVRSLDPSLSDPTDCAIFFNPKAMSYRDLAKNTATHRVIYFLLNGGHYRQDYQKWINRTQRLLNIYLAGNNRRWQIHCNLGGKQDFDLIGGIDTVHFKALVEAVPGRDPDRRLTIITQGRDPKKFKGKGTDLVIDELEGLSERVRLKIFSNKKVG